MLVGRLVKTYKRHKSGLCQPTDAPQGDLTSGNLKGRRTDDGVRLGSFSEEAGIVIHLTREPGPSTLANDSCKGFPNITTSSASGLLRKSSVVPRCAVGGKITKAGHSLRNCLGQHKAKDDGKDCAPKQREPGADAEGNCNPARRDKGQHSGACRMKLKGRKLEICLAGQNKV